MSNAFNRSSRLGIEALEAREVPSITSVVETTTTIQVNVNNNGSNVTISRPTEMSDLKITDNQTGHTWTFSSSNFLDLKKVVFVGGSGADRVSAANALQRVDLYGNLGNDVLTGGRLNDRLDGGSGNDIFRGGAGNDSIYGRGGFDYLYGDDGSDFLDDGGQSGDNSDGGTGYDFFARQVVKFGAIATDVLQNKTPTCWILAGLSAAASASGFDPTTRITYLGNGQYRVRLLNSNGGSIYQTVSLEGGRLSFEPIPHSEESWVILFHRAILQQLDFDWKDLSSYTGGKCWEPLTFLTGRPDEHHTAYAWEFTVSFLHDMRNALLQHKLVTAGTRQGNFGDGNILGNVSTPRLVGAHCYHVINVDFSTGLVTLRNPWGMDVDMSTGGTPSGDNSDGIVNVTVDQFMDSFDTVGIS
jgi:hypothetical protein